VWIRGLALLVWAADEPVGSGTGADPLVVVIGSLATAVVGGIVAIVVASINARANRTAPAPPPPTSAPATADAIGMHEDIAVLRYRADDSDERDEIQDRRLDQIERYLDIESAQWRHDGPGR
jgi:hypothetical protein